MEKIELIYITMVGAFAAMSVFDMKVAVALVVGTWLQYWFAINKSFRLFFMIVISTVFIAFFILSPLLDIFKIPGESPIRILTYSLSALISVEIISLIIKFLPNTIKDKVEQMFHLKEVKNDKQL